MQIRSIFSGATKLATQEASTATRAHKPAALVFGFAAAGASVGMQGAYNVATDRPVLGSDGVSQALLGGSAIAAIGLGAMLLHGGGRAALMRPAAIVPLGLGIAIVAAPGAYAVGDAKPAVDPNATGSPQNADGSAPTTDLDGLADMLGDVPGVVVPTTEPEAPADDAAAPADDEPAAPAADDKATDQPTEGAEPTPTEDASTPAAEATPAGAPEATTSPDDTKSEDAKAKDESKPTTTEQPAPATSESPSPSATDDKATPKAEEPAPAASTAPHEDPGPSNKDTAPIIVIGEAAPSAEASPATADPTEPAAAPAEAPAPTADAEPAPTPTPTPVAAAEAKHGTAPAPLPETGITALGSTFIAEPRAAKRGIDEPVRIGSAASVSASQSSTYIGSAWHGFIRLIGFG